MADSAPAGFSRYRLDTSDWGWVGDWIARIGHDEFFAYYNWVYSALLRLPVGRFYRVAAVADDRRELFVKFCCEFILYSPTGGDYLFSEDFSTIKRYEHYEEERKEGGGLQPPQVDT